MGQRATVVNTTDRYMVVCGEPILDTDEGVLIVGFPDGTSRTFNWDHVIDFYYMSEHEFKLMFPEESQ